MENWCPFSIFFIFHLGWKIKMTVCTRSRSHGPWWHSVGGLLLCENIDTIFAIYGWAVNHRNEYQQCVRHSVISHYWRVGHIVTTLCIYCWMCKTIFVLFLSYLGVSGRNKCPTGTCLASDVDGVGVKPGQTNFRKVCLCLLFTIDIG